MGKPSFTKDEVFEACLETLTQSGWRNFSFIKAAESSGIPLKIFSNYFPSSSEVMTYLFQKIDEQVLSATSISDFSSPKDALFEILMSRFDAAQPYKPVLQTFWKECLCTPEDLPPLAFQGFSSMAWMLEAAHLNNRGLGGLLRIQGLTTLYLLTLKVWLSDESAESENTMIYLDKGLTRLEKLSSLLHFVDP